MILEYKEVEKLGGVLIGNYHPEGHTYEFINGYYRYWVCPLYDMVSIYKRYRNEGYERIELIFYKSKEELIKTLS